MKTILAAVALLAVAGSTQAQERVTPAEGYDMALTACYEHNDALQRQDEAYLRWYESETALGRTFGRSRLPDCGALARGVRDELQRRERTERARARAASRATSCASARNLRDGQPRGSGFAALGSIMAGVSCR